MEKELYVYTNAGMSVINEVGDLPEFITVWLRGDGIANALSFQTVKAKTTYLIEYNSNIANVFKVTTACGHVRNFIP